MQFYFVKLTLFTFSVPSDSSLGREQKSERNRTCRPDSAIGTFKEEGYGPKGSGYVEVVFPFRDRRLCLGRQRRIACRAKPDEYDNGTNQRSPASPCPWIGRFRH